MLTITTQHVTKSLAQQAAFGAVETFLSLADNGPLSKQNLEGEESLLAGLSLEDRKKHKLKMKKARPFTPLCTLQSHPCKSASSMLAFDAGYLDFYGNRSGFVNRLSRMSLEELHQYGD